MRGDAAFRTCQAGDWRYEKKEQAWLSANDSRHGLNAYLNETANEKSLEAKLGYNPVKDRGQRSERMCHDWDINWP